MTKGKVASFFIFPSCIEFGGAVGSNGVAEVGVGGMMGVIGGGLEPFGLLGLIVLHGFWSNCGGVLDDERGRGRGGAHGACRMLLVVCCWLWRAGAGGGRAREGVCIFYVGIRNMDCKIWRELLLLTPHSALHTHGAAFYVAPIRSTMR